MCIFAEFSVFSKYKTLEMKQYAEELRAEKGNELDEE